MQIKKKTKIIIVILAIILLGASVAAAMTLRMMTDPGAAFADSFEQQPPELSTAPTPDFTQEPIRTETPAPEPTRNEEELLAEQADAEFMKKRVNILLLGLDKSIERAAWGSYRTDTMLLASINFDDNKIYLISIPRDSYVKIHNKKSRDKINTAFGAGGGADKNGYENAIKTVSDLFGGIAITHYVGFDMNVVKDVVNAMGGVDYDVDIEVRMNGRQLDIAQQKLDGQGVLDYSRMRKGSSDIARVDRQQRIIIALFNQLKTTKQITNIPKIYQAVESNLDTNLDFAQICSLAYFATKLDTANIERRTVEGEFLNMDSISYWGISQNKLKKLAKEVFGKNISTDPEGDVYHIKQELATRQKAISEAVNAANVKIAQAETLIAQGFEGSNLTMLVEQLRALCQEGDVDAINQAAGALNNQIDSIKQNSQTPPLQGEDVMDQLTMPGEETTAVLEEEEPQQAVQSIQPEPEQNKAQQEDTLIAEGNALID